MKPDSDQSATLSEFWRCGRCQTPNPSRSYLTHCVGCGAARSSGSVASKPDPDGPPASMRGRWIGLATWTYAALVIAALGLVRWVGGGGWAVTLLLFLPRWLFLGPILVLAIASALARRPSLWAVQAVTALIVAGPLMGISLPVHQLWAARLEGERIRVMTFNRGCLLLDADRMIQTIEGERIDLICFQEKMKPNPALEDYFAKGWHIDRTGHLVSRFPILSELTPMPDQSTGDRYYTAEMWRAVVRSPAGAEFLLVSLHLPTIRVGLERLFRGETADLDTRVAWWGRELGRAVVTIDETGDRPILIGGDFNMPSDNSTMAALRSTFLDGFQEAGWGFGYTRPSRTPWVRIDHLMASPDWSFARCWVGPDLGSDHLPLIAEVVLSPVAREGMPVAVRQTPR